MRIILQRVLQASVTIDGAVTSQIRAGFVALIGVTDADNRDIADKMLAKIAKLRVFADADGKTNLSQADVGAEILCVSQFTLYADCKKGNRPGFAKSGSPSHAREIYEYFADRCAGVFACAERGVFGADMKVSLTNDGPFTIILDSDEML